MMKFKQSTVAQPVRHMMQFKLVEAGESLAFTRVSQSSHDSVILSDLNNSKLLNTTLEKSAKKMGLKVKNGCDTMLTVTYYERNGVILSVKLLVANYVKKGE